MTSKFDPKINTIYLDMDGVVADFEALAIPLMQKYNAVDPETGKMNDDLLWSVVAQTPHFYFKIPPMPYCGDLVKLARSIGKTEMLTAIPRRSTIPSAEKDKRDWCAVNIDNEIKVNIGPFARDKWKHAKPGDILIDDHATNIHEWITKGMGIGILHDPRNYAATAEALLAAVAA